MCVREREGFKIYTHRLKCVCATQQVVLIALRRCVEFDCALHSRPSHRHLCIDFGFRKHSLSLPLALTMGIVWHSLEINMLLCAQLNALHCCVYAMAVPCFGSTAFSVPPISIFGWNSTRTRHTLSTYLSALCCQLISLSKQFRFVWSRITKEKYATQIPHS